MQRRRKRSQLAFQEQSGIQNGRGGAKPPRGLEMDEFISGYKDHQKVKPGLTDDDACHAKSQRRNDQNKSKDLDLQCCWNMSFRCCLLGDPTEHGPISQIDTDASAAPTGAKGSLKSNVMGFHD